MSVRTNKVKSIINRKNVARDFDICCVSYKKIEEMLPAYSVKLLDFNILAHFRLDTNDSYNLYLLGKRGKVNWAGYFKMLKEANPEDMTKASFRIEPDNDYILINLLCSYMHNMKNGGKLPAYGNYYGHLLDSPVPYEHVKGKSNSSRTVNPDTLMYNRIHITRENTVYVSVESWMPIEFSLDKEKRSFKKYKNKGVMERDPFDRVLSPVLVDEIRSRFKKWKAGKKEDYKNLFANWYVKGVPNHSKKNSNPFMHLQYEPDMDDKLNIFLRLIYNVKVILHDYLTMIPQSTDVTPVSVITKDQAKTVMEDYMQQAIGRINEVGLTLLFGDETQKEEALKIKEALLKNQKDFPGIHEDKVRILPVYSDYDKSSWSMQVLYDKSEYVDEETHRYNERKDEYDPTCMQHFTTNKDNETKIKVSLMELLIKDALLRKQLPETMHPHLDVTVAKKYPLYDENGKEQKGQAEYYMLSISPSGYITQMRHFKDSIMFPTEEEEKIQDKYFSLKQNRQGIKTLRPVEGLIKFGDGEYNAIFKTTERPIPDYEKIMDHFEHKYLHPGNINKEKALAYTRQFAEKTPKFIPVLEAVEEDFKKNDDTEVSIEHWRDFMKDIARKNHTNINGLTKLVREATHGEVYLQLPMKAQNNEYEMDRLTGISYRESSNGFDYYVGFRKINTIPNAKVLDRSILFRSVENDGSYTFDEFARLLDVCWVRAGGLEPTVLPYPFKYLNEYKKMVDNQRRNKRLSESY